MRIKITIEKLLKYILNYMKKKKLNFGDDHNETLAYLSRMGNIYEY